MGSQKNNSKQKIKIKKKHKELYGRMSDQSNFLFNRTNIFLLANSILLASINIRNDQTLPAILIFLGFIISILWFISSYQSNSIIGKFSVDYHKYDNEIDKLEESGKFRDILKPTCIAAIWIPLIFLILWLLLIIQFFCDGKIKLFNI